MKKKIIIMNNINDFINMIFFRIKEIVEIVNVVMLNGDLLKNYSVMLEKYCCC